MTFNAAFWKWFGKSKVVDKHGQPLVVYRGMREVPEASRMSASLGRATLSFTPDKYAADVYSGKVKRTDWGEEYFHGPGANVGAYFLSIQKPLDLREFGEQANFLSVLYKIRVSISLKPWTGKGGKQDGIIDRDMVRRIIGDLEEMQPKTKFWSNAEDLDSDGLGDLVLMLASDDYSALEVERVLNRFELDVYALADSHFFADAVRLYGQYDGIFHMDVFERGARFYRGDRKRLETSMETGGRIIEVYRPFRMNQVKSAWGNDGTWDVDDPDVRSNPAALLAGARRARKTGDVEAARILEAEARRRRR